MKKKLSLFLAMLLGSMMVGCGASDVQQNASDSQAESTGEIQTLNVGLISSISALPLLIAEEQGYFESLGLDVNIEYFKSAQDRDAALQAGELDGVLCDQIAISTYQNAGLDMKITGKTDGEMVLVAGPNSAVTSVAELEGKKIAISENTIIEFTLDQLLEQAGLTADSVEKVNIPSMPTRLEMLANGEIDAALLPAPFSDTAIASGGSALESVDSSSDLYISVTAFSQQTIDEKASAIQAYYQAYDQAVDMINSTDISAYEDMIIDTIGYPETMRGNIVVPVFNKNTMPKETTVEKALSWSREKGILEKELTAQEVMSTIGIQ